MKLKIDLNEFKNKLTVAEETKGNYKSWIKNNEYLINQEKVNYIRFEKYLEEHPEEAIALINKNDEEITFKINNPDADTKNLSNFRSALRSFRKFIENKLLENKESTSFFDVSAIVDTIDFIDSYNVDLFSNKDGENAVWDGFDPLKSIIGEDKLLKLIIESSVFFDPLLVEKRHIALVKNLKKGREAENCYARLSTKRETYEETEVKRGSKGVTYQLTPFPVKIDIDADGNKEVRYMIRDLTDYYIQIDKKKNSFSNYKISHIWGNASNPLFFTNLWNIVLVPYFANDLLDGNPGSDIFRKRLLNTFKAVCSYLYKERITSDNELGFTFPDFDSKSIRPGVYKIPLIPEKINDKNITNLKNEFIYKEIKL